MGIHPQLANIDLAVYGDLAVGREVILNMVPSLWGRVVRQPMNFNLEEASAVSFRYEVRAAINCYYLPAPVNGQIEVLYSARANASFIQLFLFPDLVCEVESGHVENRKSALRRPYRAFYVSGL
jgi:hypothetical protein